MTFATSSTAKHFNGYAAVRLGHERKETGRKMKWNVQDVISFGTEEAGLGEERVDPLPSWKLCGTRMRLT